MTAELPWTSVGVATGYRGKSGVSTASATAHGTSTQLPRLWPRHVPPFRPCNSVVPIMATDGSLRQLPRHFPRKLRTEFR